MKGINLKMKYASIADYSTGIIPVERVRTNDGRIFYSVEKAIKLFKTSDKTIRRRLSEVETSSQHNTCFRLGNKWFVHPCLKYVGKSNYHSEMFKREESILNPGGELMVNVDLHQLQQFNGATDVPVTGVTFDNGIIYYEIESFCERFTISPFTLYDYIDEVKSKKYRYWLLINGKYYVSPGILLLSKKYRKELNNLEYAEWLGHYTWTVAGSVRYTNNSYYSANRCKAIMESLTRHLKKEYPNGQHTFFYVTEQNAGEDGYHSHFVYSIENQNLNQTEFIEVMTRFLRKHHGNYERQSLIEEIDQKGHYIEYMVKQMDKMPLHWNWSDHNLLV